MLSIVISGHGNFATGIQSMLKLVLGECENTYYIDFTENLSSNDLKELFQKIYSKTEGNLVFLCDIAGGTPFNQASMLMHENNKPYSVIGGINIPLILDVLDNRETFTNCLELLQHAQQEGSSNIKIFGQSTESTHENNDDGI